MDQYHKIQTVWLRDPDTKFKTLLEGQWAKPEFEYLKDNEWVWTEKVDGTNIRVMWDGETVTFRGKTDNAQIPQFLLDKLAEKFDTVTQRQVFKNKFDGPVCLYGEGYGAKIQKGGGNYIPDGVDFILFDVLIGDFWLNREDVEDIARTLGIGVVPIMGRGTLIEAITKVASGFNSPIAHGEAQSEGLVLRPSTELKNRSGERVITKIKHRDF